MTPRVSTAVRRGVALALIGVGACYLWGWAVAALTLGALLLLPATGPVVYVGGGGVRRARRSE